jgi:hypothetical protein
VEKGQATDVHRSPDDSRANGKAARNEAPRRSHGEWEPSSARPEPIDLLEQQSATRVPDLAALRYGRMSASPFAFYRESALIMASDLAPTPRSGFDAQLCGNAHVSNFGLFAAPAGGIVFDIDEFDETSSGPWEWDVKRLAASVVVAGRERGFSEKDRAAAVLATVGRYRAAMRDFAGMGRLDVWYAQLDADELRGRQAGRLTLGPVEPQGVDPDELLARLQALFADYRDALSPEQRRLLDQYRLVQFGSDPAGNVGARTWVALLLGRDNDDPLFLQLREARESVLEPFFKPSEFENHAQRVVVGQRLLQAASDVFLGWQRVENGPEGRFDFYVRRLRERKGGVDVNGMGPDRVSRYGRLCGWTLARAHARSGDPIAIAAYLGSGTAFDEALVIFAESYADQNQRDYAALTDAIASGRIRAET